MWAVSHIGAHSRGRSLRAPVLVTSGPYALLRHPLYAGNLLLCAGFLVASRAFLPWFPLLFGALFLIQYGLFTRREDLFLEEEWGAAWRSFRDGRNAGVRGPVVTATALTQEWPTLRTILGLLALVGFRAWIRAG